MSRLITGENRYAHSKTLMKSLNILNVYQINILQHLLLMFKVKHSLIPDIFQKKFHQIDHKYPTGYSRNNYQVPQNKATYFFRLTRRGPYIWNNFLGNEEKDIPCISSFKYQIKSKLLDTENNFLFY